MTLWKCILHMFSGEFLLFFFLMEAIILGGNTVTLVNLYAAVQSESESGRPRGCAVMEKSFLTKSREAWVLMWAALPPRSEAVGRLLVCLYLSPSISKMGIVACRWVCWVPTRTESSDGHRGPSSVSTVAYLACFCHHKVLALPLADIRQWGSAAGWCWRAA